MLLCYNGGEKQNVCAVSLVIRKEKWSMTLEIEKLLDATGWQLLQELQQNARLSYSELGQRVGLSSPAVAERIRRMEDAGIISGYHAEINRARIGYPITAIIRMSTFAGERCTRFA